MGRPAYYRPKVHPSQSVLLTAMARRILRAAAKRTGKSKGDVVERLLRLYGHAVEFPQPERD